MSKASLEPEHFARLYARHIDPWRFESSAYEHAKYLATLAALDRPHYASAFEIGCSIGVLTAALAARCDDLLAIDVDDRALARAAERCAGLAQVRFKRMQLPQELPIDNFDLILLSEVGYYWSLPDLQTAAAAITSRLKTGGTLLLVHWTPFVAEHPLSGDDVHEYFCGLARLPASGLRHLRGKRQAQYRLDMFAAV